MKIGAIIKNGLIDENPTFRLVLGMCPTLAVTTAAVNGIGMGLAATFVLITSNVAVSLLRNHISDKIRLPAFIVIIATFATIMDLFMKAYLPSLYESLGIFIPLVVVNCIIFARAESFAYKNPPLASFFDGLGMGLGFTGALTLLAAIRELLGNGTLFSQAIISETYQPMLIIILPPGGFILLGFLLIAVNRIAAGRGA